MKNIFALILSFIVLAPISGCKDGTKEQQAAEETTSAPDIRLYTLDGGTVMVNNLELFSQDTTYRGQTREFADAYYIIKHPKGILMWDAGLPEALVPLEEPYTSPDGNFTVSRPDSLKTQLAAIDMNIEDIDYLALSHTHFDHTGHAESVPNATWLVQETEFGFINSEEVQQTQPDMYNALNDLENIQKISGDHDVFGDGTVIIKYMPGHTPGHSALFLDLPEKGPVLLSGDLYHIRENREFKRVPAFNYDVAQTLQSMEAFEAFASEKNAAVYLQHQKEDFDKMPKAPDYLK